MSDNLIERLRANHLDECYEAIDYIERLETDLRNSKVSEVFWRDGWVALDNDKRAVEAKLDKVCREWAEVSQGNYQRAKAAEAKLNEQIEWVKSLADDLIAAEGHEARLKDKMDKAMEALTNISNIGVAWSDSFEDQMKHAQDIARRALKELEGK